MLRVEYKCTPAEFNSFEEKKTPKIKNTMYGH